MGQKLTSLAIFEQHSSILSEALKNRHLQDYHSGATKSDTNTLNSVPAYPPAPRQLHKRGVADENKLAHNQFPDHPQVNCR